MFKVESYITPLLLSYVDKYIKNLKPEDSQVSLWGGDAVFSNLDLRLDVLEQELRMPFNFVNGHIHELRIHVPWTKLGSEPVVITINTIECVLKLCENGESSSADGSNSIKSSSGAGLKLRGEPKVVNASTTGDDQSSSWVTPPTYVQSLINRVLNNISVVCNNVILKYVEDDIVLSLNVKSFEVVSASVAWDEIFADLTFPELVLRKLIRLQDLTVCLDRRNASGKITTYQDPLLYRCSLECRLHMSFDSLHGKHLLSSRLDVLCGRLDFSVTDQQLPLFLRLIELCLALHAREITYQPLIVANDGGGGSAAAVGFESQVSSGQPSDILDSDVVEQQGWSSWMWSYVPAGFVGWTGEEGEVPPSDLPNLPSAVCRFGVYIREATFVIKATKSQTSCTAAFGLQKVTFRPLCAFRMDGVFLDVTFRGIDVFGVQMGISRVIGSLSGVCPCGVHDCAERSSVEMNGFFMAGNADDEQQRMENKDSNDDNRYLLNSLFDERSPENCKQRRGYVFDWDEHFARSLYETIGHRTSAFLFDYFYLMEVPDDLSDESSGLSVCDLEHSNLKERASMRIVVGPTKLDVTSSVVHRAQFISHSASFYDYEPYSTPKTDDVDDGPCPPPIEELAALEKFIPSRSMSVVIVKPVVRIFVADHPFVDIPLAKPRTSILKSELIQTQQQRGPQQPPVLVIHAGKIHLSRSNAMYPRRVVKAASTLWPPSEHLLYNCHYHFSIKGYGCGLNLVRCADSDDSSTLGQVLVAPSDVSIYLKWLLHQSYFKNPMIPRKDALCEASCVSISVTAPHVALVKGFYNSWFTPRFRVMHFHDSSLIDDVFEGTKDDRVEFVVTNVTWRKCDTNVVTAYACSVGSVNVLLYVSGVNGKSLVPVLVAPADVSESLLESDDDHWSPSTMERVIDVTLQLPKSASLTSAPSVAAVSVKGVAAHFDPSISAFVSYQPRFYHLPRKIIDTTMKETRAPPTNQCSSNPGDADRGSVFSSTATNVPTDPMSRTPRLARPQQTIFAQQSSARASSQLLVDLFPLLNNLIVQMDLDGIAIFVSRNPIQWTRAQPGSVPRMTSFAQALMIRLPSVSVTNGGQKVTPFIASPRDVPLTTLDGWNVGAGDKFPWKVELKNFSVMSAVQPKRAECCLAPGCVSATVAVTTKTDGLDVSHLSVCVHCDIRQVHFSLSQSQAQLISSLLGYYVELFINAATLFGMHDVATMTSLEDPSIDLSQNRLVTRLESMTSGVVETLPDPAMVTAISRDAQEERPVSSSSPKLMLRDGGSDREPVKVSLWVQTTLPKLTVDVVGEQNNREVRLTFELEDISSSVDVQDVYSKVKLKITSVNSTNSSRCLHDGNWIPGPFEGITLCCADRIATSVYMTNPKTGMKTICPHAAIESGGSLLEQSSRGSFLTATFTRAQCRNVQKRWAKVLRDSSGSNFGAQLMSEVCDGSSQHVRCISEIDLKMMPLDCVVWAPLYYAIADVFTPLANAIVSVMRTLKTRFVASEDSPQGERSSPSVPLFSSATLPLMYVNFSTIRLFLPFVADEDGGDTKIKRGRPNGSKRRLSHERSEDDFLMLQVDSVYLTPNVDNPLSRVVLKSDIFSVAQRAGILHIPGSEIEDRQYQLDVTGLSLATGVWDELMSYTKKSLPPGDVTQLKTMGENPALEWNTKIRLEDNCDALDDSLFCPLVWRFDLRIVVAPAIVYERNASNDMRSTDDILVAAHSMELNVMTDIDVYAGLHQLLLLRHLAEVDTSVVDKAEKRPSREVRDSGIDSESSALNPLIVESRKPPVFPLKPVIEQKVSESDDARDKSTCTPFEVLVTARCVNVTTYSPEYLMPVRVVKPPKPPVVQIRIVPGRTRRDLEWTGGGQSTSTEDSPVRVVKPKRKRIIRDDGVGGTCRYSEMEGYEGSEEESQDDDGDDDHSDSGSQDGHGSRPVPLFHLFVSQPHAMLKWHGRVQKLEISCYDVIVKGRRSTKTGKNFVSRHFPWPKLEDYGVIWFDTLPGDIDHKTGVPPALYTLTATDFRKCSVHLKVERPWRVCFSSEIHEEILQTADILRTLFASPAKNMDAEPPDEQKLDGGLTRRFRSFFTGFREIGYQTGQVILSYSVSAKLIFAVSHAFGSVSFRGPGYKEEEEAVAAAAAAAATAQQETAVDVEVIDSVTLKLEFGGLIIQTGFADEEPRSMIGPLSLASSMTAVWHAWNAFTPYPQLLWKLDVDTVFVAVDRQHLHCLEMIAAHLTEDTIETDSQALAGISGRSTFLEELFAALKRTKVAQKQTWQDDLRVGTFQYTQHSDDSVAVAPASNEIIFCKEHDGLPASMTWRYSQPRCLTRVEIQPVPFRAASEVVALHGDEIQIEDDNCEVRCALQLYDELQRRFVTYRVFQLSEVEHCFLDVPPVDDTTTWKDVVVVSQTWRVVMDFLEDLSDAVDRDQTRRRGLVSPLALAACMRIDSCFDACFVPLFESLITVDLVRITLSNHFPEKRSTASFFQLDGTMPDYQEFLIATLENLNLRCRQWRSMVEFDLDTTFVCELVDYRFLTLRHLVEPMTAKMQLFAVDGRPKPMIVEVSIDFGPMFVHLSQTAVHTLTNALAAFGNKLDSHSVVVCMNRYVISNGTVETLRFGQVDTDESVTLQSNRSHAYSWRSHRKKQVLHICVEGMRWKWCDPFSVDTIGSQVRVIKCKTKVATLLIEVSELSATQVHVVIAGRLTVANKLDLQFELRLQDSAGSPSLSDDCMSDRSERITVLERKKCSPSLVIQRGDSWIIQLRLAGQKQHVSEESCWSRNIDTNDSSLTEGMLMSVSSADDPNEKFGIWIHAFSQQITVSGDVVSAAAKKLVVLTPLYLVRSHLPHPLTLEVYTPSLGRTVSYEVCGMGREHEFFCPGQPELEHAIRFRLMPDLEVSDPPLPLTPAIIGQATKQPPPVAADIQAFYDESMNTLPYRWPYDDEDLERNVISSPMYHFAPLKAPVSKNVSSAAVNSAFQPNIDLIVSWSQRWPGCNALVVDVKPWALFVNRTGCEVVFSVGRDLMVASGAVFALPKIEKSFKLGLSFGDAAVFYSDVIELSSEDLSINRYWQRVDGVLPMNGYVLCDIRVEVQNVTKICHLTMTATLKEGMRIFTVQNRLTVLNETTSGLTVGAFSVPQIGKKLRLDCDDVTAVRIPRECPPTPILFWDVFNVFKKLDHGSVDGSYVQYVLFSSEAEVPRWGRPCRIEPFESPDRILSVAIPTSDTEDDNIDAATAISSPLRVSFHHHRGRIFLVAKEDKYPQIMLHNNCNFALNFGQGSSTNSEGEDCVIYEEQELLDTLPVIGPHATCFYTFPFVAEKFPEIFDSRQLPKLHLSKATHLDIRVESTTSSWSDGLNVTTSGDQFLSIPNCADVKVHVEMAEGVVHVFLDPVNRVEVSAKEIRSRISTKEVSDSAQLQSLPTSWRKPRFLPISRQKIVVSTTSKKTPKNPDLNESVRQPRSHPKKSVDIERIWLYGTVHLKHVCVILIDDVSEILRVCADHVHLSTRPAIAAVDDRLVPLQRQEVLVCVTDVQVDNQLHCTGEHDFSVVLVRQDALTGDSGPLDSSSSTDAVRREALLVVSVVLERIKGGGHGTWFAYSAEFTVKPIAAYVEDTLFYKLSRYCQSFAMPNCVAKHGVERLDVVNCAQLVNVLVPDEVVLRAANLGSPLIMRRFVVNPTSVLASVHASMKLFVSLNRTPLSFKAFERQAINTTWYRLGHALTMHYLSGALFRAGWVIGSLDLLANPGGFARAVSTGMADFVRLPYHGMTRGPWAFVVGVVHGSSSLLRHIGSGTLLSITSLAESVSRNMDRLSLDGDHLRRNEELRRFGPPSGVASGLAQGLTGFGVGLLGAVAGIVDQPLQSIQESDNQQLVTTAAGIVSGVGRGLVGIVTKPIGGAAELVSQTGQGILHCAGWAQVLKCRYDPIVEDSSSRVNSTLKYVWKMLPIGDGASKVFAIEATHFNSGPVQYAAAVLLLTPEVLFVVSTEADTQQQAFPLGELDCRGHTNDPTLVYFVARRSSDPEAAFTQLEDRNRDRIADFIDKSSKYALVRSPSSSKGGDEMESVSDASSHASQVPVGSASAQFYVNPRLRLAFLNLYRAAQRRLHGKGYPT